MQPGSEGEDPQIGIAIGDLQARCLQVNRKVADLLGRSPDDLRHAAFDELVHPDDAPTVRNAVRGLLSGAASEAVIERRCLRKNGTSFWGRATLALVEDDEGRPSRILAVIEDLTARQQAESERGRLMSVLEKSLNEIYMFDTASLRFTYVNQGALRNIGYTMEQMRRMTPLDIKPEFTPASFGAMVRPLLEGTQEKHVFHTVHRRSDGTTYPVEVHLQCVAHAGQRLFVAIILDTTERRRTEEALRESHERAEEALREAERANRLKDQFLATLSHELRTPLSSILGWTQILRRGARDPADLARGLDTIERNARAQTKLIEDLLDMSRITSGKLRLEMQRVRPAAFVQAALETVRPAAEAKGVRIQTALDPDAGTVAGDPGRLQQVVWNLLSNAIKFTPSGGRVAVAARRIDERVEVSVSDTGIGIEPRFLPQLFERFSQADPSPTRRHGGLGLGLSIVRHLVELHGGTVHAESDGPGLGATFSIRLPVHAAAPLPAEAEGGDAPTVDVAPVELPSVDLTGVRVLVVDDQPDARALAERLLADCGAEVWSAGSGEDAVARARSGKPDVVVSDIGMPGMDGYEMLRRIRELEGDEAPAIRAIALTAFARPQDAERAGQAGFDAHLTKPLDAARLIAAVAALAGRGAAPRQRSLAGMQD